MSDYHQRLETDVLVVGSGAGATAFCTELLKQKNLRVTVAEKGKKNVDWGAGIDERGKRIYKEDGGLPKSKEGLVYYRHTGVGGTVEVACGNGVRISKEDISKLGISIEEEMAEVEDELGITPVPDNRLGPNSRLMISAASDLGYTMRPMPKFIDFEKCTGCAECEFICPCDAKWSSRQHMEALERNGKLALLDGVNIEKIEMEKDTAQYATGLSENGLVKVTAKAFVLAGSALGTPVILQNSGFRAGSNLFMDLYTVVYGRNSEFGHKREIPMPAFYHHEDDTFVIAPYLDPELSFFLHQRNASNWFGGENLDGLMVKIKDDSGGRVLPDGSIRKWVTENDQRTLDRGIDIAKEILLASGVREDSIVATSPRGAHPGGTAAIGREIDKTLRVRQTTNLYVADSSVFPASLGKPPIVAIMAIGKKLAKSIEV